MAAVAQKSVFFLAKKLALLTGNTWESLQCVIFYQKYPEGACRPFKVMTKNVRINHNLRRCLRWDLVLEAEPKSSSSYGSDIRQVGYTLFGCFGRENKY